MKKFMKKTLLAALLAAPLFGSATVGYAMQDNSNRIQINNIPNNQQSLQNLTVDPIKDLSVFAEINGNHLEDACKQINKQVGNIATLEVNHHDNESLNNYGLSITGAFEAISHHFLQLPGVLDAAVESYNQAIQNSLILNDEHQKPNPIEKQNSNWVIQEHERIAITTHYLKEILSCVSRISIKLGSKTLTDVRASALQSINDLGNVPLNHRVLVNKLRNTIEKNAHTAQDIMTAMRNFQLGSQVPFQAWEPQLVANNNQLPVNNQNTNLQQNVPTHLIEIQEDALQAIGGLRAGTTQRVLLTNLRRTIKSAQTKEDIVNAMRAFQIQGQTPFPNWEPKIDKVRNSALQTLNNLQIGGTNIQQAQWTGARTIFIGELNRVQHTQDIINAMRIFQYAGQFQFPNWQPTN